MTPSRRAWWCSAGDALALVALWLLVGLPFWKAFLVLTALNWWLRGRIRWEAGR